MDTSLINNLDFTKIIDELAYHSDKPMIFSSAIFLFLFLFFTFFYFLLQKKDTMRILFVTLFSYYFYYKSSGVYFILLSVVTCSDFVIAKRMAVVKSKVSRNFLLFFSLIVNLGMLAYFKYTNFFYEQFSLLFQSKFEPLDIFLPVGISFFTFQSLSYTIDVYRGELKPLNRLLDYAFYVSFFPQLVAGPIVRARDFIPQIRKPLFVSNEMYGTGIFFIVTGLFKKAVISDYISVNFVERVFDNPTLYSGLENLFAIYGYALQIYCDFSGYSDMAIGIALLLGFHFPLNFRSPYKSASVSEFWRRWHISLSTWLKDYLYISLGGNRKGKIRTYLNLIITMLLGGLWHGASWNFVIWGGLHGSALAVHKFWSGLTGKYEKQKNYFFIKIFNVILTFNFVCFCWLFFRCSSFENALSMINQVLFHFEPHLFLEFITGYSTIVALMGLAFVLHFLPESWEEMCKKSIIHMPFVVQASILVGLIYLVIQVKSSDIQPFIYFQF